MQTPTSTFTKTGDLGGQVFEMGMDESAMNHILGILTEIYSDDELAVIREYSTNALDAQIEAGYTGPIEVFTPNALSPFFRVRDHGVGLSIEDVEKVFSKYGASTKRGTNEQVGMLGIGAKSALALVPQFNVVSVKGGVKISVVVSRNETGAAEMRVVDSRATAEPNGVEVMIPVPRSHSFMQKVRDFFRFWKPGTVLVDGKEPEFITGRPVGDKFLVNSDLHNDYIVMGNIAYPYKGSLYEHGYHYRPLGVVAFVGVGDVNFAPSREELHYTPKTNATVESLKKEFTAELVTAAQKDIDDAPTHAEAWHRAKQWRASFHNRLGDLTYQGVKVPSDIPFGTYPDPVNPSYPKNIEGKEVDFQAVRRNPRSYANWIRSVNPTMLDSYMFVTGFAEILKMSPVQRERATIYAANQGWSVNKVVIFKEPEIVTDSDHLKFLEGMKIVPWSEIAKIKIARPKTAGGKSVRAEKYDQFMGGYDIQQVSEFDVEKPIIYISTAEDRKPNFLREIFPDAQVVLLSQNRWQKFTRDWPTAEHYLPAIRKVRESLIAQLTETDKILWNHGDHYSRRQYGWLESSRIEDPDLKRFAEILNGKTEYSDAAKKLREMGRYCPRDIEGPESPLKKYPMSGSLWNVDSDHAHWYVNSYYAHINSQED